MAVLCVWRLLGLLAVMAWLLMPNSCLPVDMKEHKLREWERQVRELEEGGAVDGTGFDLCFLCEGAVNAIRDYLEENASVHTLYPLVEPMCVFFMNKSHGYNGRYMCPGLIYTYFPVILYVVAEGALKPSDLCYLVHLCHNDSLPTSLPSSLPSSLPHLSTLMKAWERHSPTAAMEVEGTGYHMAGRGGGEREKSVHKTGGKRGGDEVTFLQLSDIHLDQLYSEGSPSQCNLFLCCRSWYNGTGPAGHYGNINCDLPLMTLDLVVETISQLDPQPDFIIYTGDNSPHDVWNETWASQIQATEFVTSYLMHKLPHKRIYPAIGNHESHPVSEYTGSLPDYQNLNRKLAQYWQSLVPLPQSALDTISDGAYYTILIQDRLRLISFNSNYGYSINFYTTLNRHNPYFSRQQAWISDTLHQAEKDGEKVIMMAHVPPGDPGNTLHAYEEFYLNLTKTYRDTIVGHLFGHTHHDEFKLIQDQDGVYGTIMASPSVTPQGRSSPSFRVFSMSNSTFQLQGYQQFHLNLTLANELAAKGVKPKMELAYTTSDLYQLPDLSPDSWANLVERFSNNPHMVSEYRYNMYGRTSSSDLSCDSQCIRETICTVSNIVLSERAKCMGS